MCVCVCVLLSCILNSLCRRPARGGAAEISFGLLETKRGQSFAKVPTGATIVEINLHICMHTYQTITWAHHAYSFRSQLPEGTQSLARALTDAARRRRVPNRTELRAYMAR